MRLEESQITRIGKLVFYQTSGACPEQYDVYFEEKIVAYVRLRWGVLVVREMGDNENVIFRVTFPNQLKGCFMWNEREKYLKVCAREIKRKVLKKLS